MALDTTWQAGLLAIIPTAINHDRTLLDKHLAAYTAKHSFDYFIHKNLAAFLRQQLDFYLKTEVVDIDDFDSGSTERMLQVQRKVRAIRKVAHKLIDFLAQLEDFQKQLWLKKKFVLETHYCITLDRVPESLLQEVVNNERQCNEWIDLFDINDESEDVISDRHDERTGTPEISTQFLQSHPHLMIDTRHFNSDFKDRLLTAISEADEIHKQLDGLLIHGENFQALRLLHRTYDGRIKNIHIDPPYNTQTSGFLYKNDYQHSSWMTMMENRIAESLPLLNHEGSFLCHIDENEYERLHLLMNSFPIEDQGTVIWDKRNPMTGGKGIATQHEYLLWRSNSSNAFQPQEQFDFRYFEHGYKHYRSLRWS